jgi:hypothetical protein
MAAQTLTHHEPYRVSGSLKYIQVAPEDAIWSNLVMKPLRAPRAISTFLGCNCWTDHPVGDSWFVALRFNVVRV